VEFVAGMVCSDDCDTNELTEMLIAYIPRVGEIDSLVSTILVFLLPHLFSSVVNEWALQLSDKLRDEGKHGNVSSLCSGC